jgi:adenylosuccinate synthase
MPVSVVIGGQFGSEGKGKVAHVLAANTRAAAVVRVGGPNSGHTGVAVDPAGRRELFRQLPTAAVLPGVMSVLGPGSYIDLLVLEEEIARVGLTPGRLAIDPNAVIVAEEDRAIEREAALGERIGSTQTGTGAAVVRRALREQGVRFASHESKLAPFVQDTSARLRKLLDDGERVLVEGTQGLGLSVLHSPHYPYVTSRDTTAAGAVAEAGLSPMDIDEVVLVIRSFPIRVAGNSGPFGSEEITWDALAAEGGHATPFHEVTSVTKRARRVSRFDPRLVRRAIAVNQPTLMVLNHVDYVDADQTPESALSTVAAAFVRSVEAEIGRRIDLIGLGPDSLVSRAGARSIRVA